MSSPEEAFAHVVVFSRPPGCGFSRDALAQHLHELWREAADVTSYDIDIDMGRRGEASADVLGRAQFASWDRFEAYLATASHKEFLMSVVRANDISLVSLQTRL